MLDRLTRWCFLAIFLIFPFQKRNKIFRSFSKSLIPEDAHFPDFFSTSIFYYLTDVLILVFTGLCLYRFRHQLRELFFSGPAKYLILFVCVAGISITQSITPTYAVHYLRLVQFSLAVLFFCSAMAFVQTQRVEKLLTQVCWIGFLTGMIEAGVAIGQYFVQGSLGLKWMGESSFSAFMFPMAAGERWIFDSLVGYSTGTDFLLRARGTLAHPNILGGFLFFSLMTTYYLCLKETKRVRLWLLQTGIFLLVFALSVSFSRSAIISVLMGSMLWGGIVAYRHYFISKNQEIRRYYRLGLIVSISMLTCLTLFYSQFFYRGGIVSSNDIVKGADSERVVYNKVAWEMVKESPVLGVGFNQFQLHAQRLTPTEYPYTLYSKVHNIYLLIFAETGLCGFIAFGLFFAVLIIRLWRSSYDSLSLLAIVLFIGMLFIGMCDFYLLEGSFGRMLFFTSCLLGILATRTSSQAQPDKILAFIAKKG